MKKIKDGHEGTLFSNMFCCKMRICSWFYVSNLFRDWCFYLLMFGDESLRSIGWQDIRFEFGRDDYNFISCWSLFLHSTCVSFFWWRKVNVNTLTRNSIWIWERWLQLYLLLIFVSSQYLCSFLLVTKASGQYIDEKYSLNLRGIVASSLAVNLCFFIVGTYYEGVVE